eukprot:TRINITY_DN3720_c0_g2_i1.p1 TRINITY_DN3720_c0_g2~~TRINITY_DN3720_c0_g2_i1.p1  ORF type:complete len:532 (+),score=211.70 TRINITY_DN3720_c0_g2_i1:46-1641(+)
MPDPAAHAADAKEYIRAHGVHLALEKLTGEVLEKKPADPLVYIALRLLEDRGLPAGVLSEEKLTKILDLTPDEALEVLGKKEAPKRPSRKQVISARACCVCGRDDRPGLQRSKGFKCHECVGIPSNPVYAKEIEEANKLIKGRDEEGGFTLNDYRIITTIGQGAYGRVRLCVHNKSQQTYAVKFLSKTLLMKKIASGNPMKDDGLKKIREEIKIMKQLQHPNIIQIYGTMESESELMIVMEHLEGQIYPSTYPATPIPLRKLKRYLVGIAQGLQFLHDKGIIHRDIKPDNILLDRKDNVKLADFGVSAFAAECSEGLMVTGFAGSPFFMPPEAFSTEGGNNAKLEGPATDIWAFGVTLYTMAHGKLPPFTGSNVADLGKSIASTTIEFKHESAELNEVLSKMLEKNPADRATLDFVLHHDLVRDIRIVKGHPVETVELGLEYDKVTKNIHIVPDEQGDAEGGGILSSFMEQSKRYFQIIQGNPYEVTLYDLARDPRRQARSQPPETRHSQQEGQITIEDWQDSDVEEELDF